MRLVHRDGLCVQLLDIKKAHLNGKVQPDGGEHYLQAPPEKAKVNMCWELKRWLCGMRPAARA